MDRNGTRVLVAAADPQERLRLTALLAPGGFACSACGDRREAVSALRAVPCGILCMEMTLRGGDALDVLEDLPGARLEIALAVIVLLHSGMEGFADRLRDSGACEVLPRLTGPEQLLAACRAVTADDRLYAVRGREGEIAALLAEMGFSAGHRGTALLREGLRYTLSDARLLGDLSHGLYPLLADRAGLDGAGVERSIRHAIEAAAASGRYERQYALFGNTIEEKRGKPTNGAMLARATEYLRTKEFDVL